MKLIGLLMVKNESAILERCLEHLIPHVDAVYLLDTGSTDNTLAVARRVLTQINEKPFLLEESPFETFGKSRTRSFQGAQRFVEEMKWDPYTSYVIAIDADMVLCPSASFRDYPLTKNGYTMVQANGHLRYDNTRIMKCAYPWTCIGATHEYWSGEGTSKIPYEVCWIDDRNDGGCKSDKFERDIRLLNSDIEENPKNDRAHYYLGQSLKDSGKWKEAIPFFEKRIELGGWQEEVHYAHYQIGKCYELLNKPVEMEYWMNRAYEYYPKKAEPIYHLTRYFREKSQHYKAYHYYLKGKDIPFPEDCLLFLEENVYKGLFEYEATILDCYVLRTRQESLERLIRYINQNVPFYRENVFDNMVYYVESLVPSDSKTYKGKYSRLLFPDINEYRASSCSVIRNPDSLQKSKYIMNVRYVNYEIDGKGSYIMSSSDPNETNVPVRTKNAMVELNNDGEPIHTVTLMTEEYERKESHIQGLEDIRLFYLNNTLHALASCKDIVSDGRIVMTHGKYNIDTHTITDLIVVDSPKGSTVEKNWTIIPESLITEKQFKVIYSWHPLEIGTVYENKLILYKKHDTPEIFKHCRGSTPLILYNNSYWCVLHIVKYSTPRIYSHMVVQLDLEFKIVQYTIPFSFRRNRIEYCIGFDIEKDTALFFFSENDSTPGKIQISLSNLKWI